MFQGLIVAVTAVLVGLDQLTKWLAVMYLQNGESVTAIPRLFNFTYAENTGAAFGILKDHRWVFLTISTVTIIGMTLYLYLFRSEGRLYDVAIAMIISGGIGNMIDRLRLDYVVDFLYFSLINFPIFNVADIYVTCATILLAGLLLFYYKEEDLKFLSIRPKKYREVKLQEAEEAVKRAIKEFKY